MNTKIKHNSNAGLQTRRLPTSGLWGEGFDWFDMKRWGDTINRKSFDKGGNYVTALALTITPEQNNKWTWMVPLKETDYNHGY